MVSDDLTPLEIKQIDMYVELMNIMFMSGMVDELWDILLKDMERDFNKMEREYRKPVLTLIRGEKE